MSASEPGSWRPIETAPKEIVSTYWGACYGPYILVYTGEVQRARWWQASDEKSRSEGYQNFLADGGNAVHPTHWMPLPPPPIGRD